MCYVLFLTGQVFGSRIKTRIYVRPAKTPSQHCHTEKNRGQQWFASASARCQLPVRPPVAHVGDRRCATSGLHLLLPVQQHCCFGVATSIINGQSTRGLALGIHGLSRRHASTQQRRMKSLHDGDAVPNSSNDRHPSPHDKCST
ncbi:TPA: hypothetical protein N0F65_003333 [Lagenidium giganteum]|uniref:Secreted protein n=1 Tax=Lagenidium giganteum TaxID=4803 RepID=A0AAV2Z6V6_9STRA|nr:TPA: hypothetical protein N0F65_003333 [Lagenidium giganteum]